MSVLSVAPYFPFAGVWPLKQVVEQIGADQQRLIILAPGCGVIRECEERRSLVIEVREYKLEPILDGHVEVLD